MILITEIANKLLKENTINNYMAEKERASRIFSIIKMMYHYVIACDDICVSECVCAQHACTHTHRWVCMHVEVRGQLWVSP